MQGSDWTTSGPPSSHGPSQDSAASVPLIPYLRQQKEVHEREQIRLGLAPLPPYILQQFTPSEIIHNYLMQMDSFVTIKEWHSRFCKSPAFMKVRVGIIQVKIVSSNFFSKIDLIPNANLMICSCCLALQLSLYIIFFERGMRTHHQNGWEFCLLLQNKSNCVYTTWLIA